MKRNYSVLLPKFKESEEYDFDEFFSDDMLAEIEADSQEIEKQNKTTKQKYKEDQSHSGSKYILALLESLHYQGLLKKDSTILELGAGRGWLSCQLAKYSDNVVLTDINDAYMHYVYGYQKITNTSFDTYLIPMQNVDVLFAPKAFDFVFTKAAIHHCEDLDSTLKTISSIMKDNGRLYLLNELMIGRFQKNKDMKKAAEIGYQDQPYNVADYVKTARKYFDVEWKVSPQILSYVKGDVKVKSSKSRKLLLSLGSWMITEKSIENPIFRLSYYWLNVLLGGLPADIICIKQCKD